MYTTDSWVFYCFVSLLLHPINGQIAHLRSKSNEFIPLSLRSKLTSIETWDELANRSESVGPTRRPGSSARRWLCPSRPGLRGPRAASTDVISSRHPATWHFNLIHCRIVQLLFVFLCDLIHPLFAWLDLLLLARPSVLCFALLD